MPKRHFGVIFGTYILAEGDGEFYIIDQHTAHERVNYERIRGKFEELASKRQPLLAPVVQECSRDELEQVLENKDELLACGFLVEEFGPESYVVREVPAYIDPGTEREAVVHVMERLLEGENSVRIYDELAAMRSCKASIKKNDYIAPEMLSEILVQLSECENPARCPHGRPTMVRLSREELDRMFHR